VNQTVPGRQISKKPASRRGLILSGVLVLILLLGLGIYGYTQWLKPLSTYGKLVDYKLAGLSAGKGISFKRPSKTVIDSTSTNLPNQVAFAQIANKHTQAYAMAYSSAMDTSEYQQHLLKDTPKALADPSQVNYSIYSAIPKDFVASNTLSTAQIKYSVAKPFTNQFIHTNAWKFDFTITNPSNKATGQGVLVYALGQKTYYFFLIYADKDYWQTGQTVWNQLLTSVKIDQ